MQLVVKLETIAITHLFVTVAANLSIFVLRYQACFIYFLDMIIEITEKCHIGLGQKVQIHLTFKPLLFEVMNQCPLFDQLVTDYVW